MNGTLVIRPELNERQAEFLFLDVKFKSFVGGFGSGKTYVGCCGLAKHFWGFPRIDAGYFAPTYPQIRDIFYPTVEECFYNWGLRTQVKEGNHEVFVYSGTTFRGIIKCRSMDNPQTIVGFKIGHALVDEIDVMPVDKASLA